MYVYFPMTKENPSEKNAILPKNGERGREENCTNTSTNLIIIVITIIITTTKHDKQLLLNTMERAKKKHNKRSE